MVGGTFCRSAGPCANCYRAKKGRTPRIGAGPCPVCGTTDCDALGRCVGIMHFLVPTAVDGVEHVRTFGITTGAGFRIRALTVFRKHPRGLFDHAGTAAGIVAGGVPAQPVGDETMAAKKTTAAPKPAKAPREFTVTLSIREIEGNPLNVKMLAKKGNWQNWVNGEGHSITCEVRQATAMLVEPGKPAAAAGDSEGGED